MMMESMLIGNTFPLTLMRRRLMVDVVPLEELRRAAAGKRVVSFWGHANTLRAASAAVGFDLLIEVGAAGAPADDKQHVVMRALLREGE